MRKSATWNRLLATTVISGLATFGVAAPAFAQQPEIRQPTPETTLGGDDPTVTDTFPETTGTSGTTITVTGSRIARPDLTAPSPVTIIDDEQVALTGTTTLENLLNDLPQIIPGNNRTSNNAGGFPFSTLDLRGLGASRTLILVDGERLPASSASGVVDIAQIPVGLIERIDVVTGGASAVYGSDAMAGVVNFILKQDFQGIELTGQMGIAEEGVGFNYHVSGMFGGNFADGRGNITIYASYFDRESVSQSRYDFSRVSAAIFCVPPTAGAAGCPAGSFLYPVSSAGAVVPGSNPAFLGGSATPPWGLVNNDGLNPFNIAALSAAFPNTIGPAGTPPGCHPTASHLTINNQGQLTRYYGGGLCSIPERAIGSSRYNFAPDNFMTIPYDRFNLSTIARYEFNDTTRARLFAAYTNSTATVNLAPTPAAGGTGFRINPTQVAANCVGLACALPAGLQAALASRPNPDAPFLFDRRFSETGPRVGITESQSIIGRLVLEHDISPDWRIAGALGWGRSDLVQESRGNVNRVAVDQALVGCVNAAGVRNGPGVLPGCIPINIYGPNTLTPAMVNFIRTDTIDFSEFEQIRGAVNVTGSLWNLPGGPVGVAAGAEVRTDRGFVRRDDAKIRGEIIGFNAQQNQQGEITVKEVYGEIRLPILGGGGFPDLLAVELGARYSDYSTIGGLFNWKAAAEFAPVRWLRFRGAYNRAARAPNIFELFQAGDQGFPAFVDPCNAPAGLTRPNCVAQIPGALLPTFQQSNSQVQAFAFGQPDLSEERAETFTIGAVLTPAWWPVGRMSLTVDYYDIEITNRIATLGAAFYINGCYINNDPAACARVNRDPGTGQILSVATGRTNSAVPLVARGIDVGFNWTIPLSEVFGGTLGGGRLRISEVFSWTMDYKIGTSELVDRIAVGVGAPVSEWSSALTVAYDQGPFTGQVRWIYSSGANQDDFFGAAFPVDRTQDLSYIDLSLRWQVSERFEFTGIVYNLFDQRPRQTISGVFEQSNTNVSFLSPIILGRSYAIQARVRF